MTGQYSLRARAVAILSRREHSRAELRRKLLAHAASEDEVDALLDALERENWLSNDRFATSIVHRRAERFGTRRIVSELKTHQLSAEQIARARSELEASEYERALAAWQKKFGSPPADARERGRQMRFMLARGFAADTVARIVGACGERCDMES